MRTIVIDSDALREQPQFIGGFDNIEEKMNQNEFFGDDFKQYCNAIVASFANNPILFATHTISTCKATLAHSGMPDYGLDELYTAHMDIMTQAISGQESADKALGSLSNCVDQINSVKKMTTLAGTMFPPQLKLLEVMLIIGIICLAPQVEDGVDNDVCTRNCPTFCLNAMEFHLALFVIRCVEVVVRGVCVNLSDAERDDSEVRTLLVRQAIKDVKSILTVNNLAV